MSLWVCVHRQLKAAMTSFSAPFSQHLLLLGYKKHFFQIEIVNNWAVRDN